MKNFYVQNEWYSNIGPFCRLFKKDASTDILNSLFLVVYYLVSAGGLQDRQPRIIHSGREAATFPTRVPVAASPSGWGAAGGGALTVGSLWPAASQPGAGAGQPPPLSDGSETRAWAGEAPGTGVRRATPTPRPRAPPTLSAPPPSPPAAVCTVKRN